MGGKKNVFGLNCGASNPHLHHLRCPVSAISPDRQACTAIKSQKEKGAKKAFSIKHTSQHSREKRTIDNIYCSKYILTFLSELHGQWRKPGSAKFRSKMLGVKARTNTRNHRPNTVCWNCQHFLRQRKSEKGRESCDFRFDLLSPKWITRHFEIGEEHRSV